MQSGSDFQAALPEMGVYVKDQPSKMASPSTSQIASGVSPGTTLPAQWWNYYINALTSRNNVMHDSVGQLFFEMENFIRLAGITPSSKSTSQLATAVQKLINDAVASKMDKDLGNVTGVLAVSHGGTGAPSMDSTPTSGSARAITSNAVYNALQSLQTTLEASFNSIVADYAARQGVIANTPRFIQFDFSAPGHKNIVIKKGTHIRLDVSTESAPRWYDTKADISITNSVTTAGTNVYIYLVPSGTAGKAQVVFSANSTYPSGYTANNSRKIGQFHNLGVAAGASLKMKIGVPKTTTTSDTVKVKNYGDGSAFDTFYTKAISSLTEGLYYSVAEVAHPLAGFAAGDILPESVWCLTFHPHCDPSGMVYDKGTDKAVDIYLQSGRGANTASVFNGAITRVRPQPQHEDDMRCVNKTLLSVDEFSSAALGCAEKATVGADPVITTGRIYGGRRAISAIGCEDMAGAVWQWTRNEASLGYGHAYGNIADPRSGLYTAGKLEPADGGDEDKWLTLDGTDAFGGMYCITTAPLVGGAWGSSVNCGSRCRSCDNAVSNVSMGIGGRGSSHVLRNVA